MVRPAVGLLAQHRLRVLVNGGIPGRTHTGLVAMPVVRGRGMAVHTAGIMVMVIAPGCGAPIGHIATGIQLIYHINGAPCMGVAIYRATVGVAVYREAVGIVAGRCPSYGRAVTIGGIGEGTVAIGINLAGGHQQGSDGKKATSDVSVFHHINKCGFSFYCVQGQTPAPSGVPSESCAQTSCWRSPRRFAPGTAAKPWTSADYDSSGKRYYHAGTSRNR